MNIHIRIFIKIYINIYIYAFVVYVCKMYTFVFCKWFLYEKKRQNNKYDRMVIKIKLYEGSFPAHIQI